MTSKKVYSITEGKVVECSYDKGGFGNYIAIEEISTKYRIYFAHLQFIYCKLGDYIHTGDLVGQMGMTGNATGEHTHVEIRDLSSGKIIRLNPATYMNIPNEVGIYNSIDFPQNNPQPVDNIGGFEMKIYKNGSTKEPVYSDTKLVHNIGYLNPYEACECYGIINNLALVVYNVDNTNGTKKTGFVKWLGGIK